FRTRFSGACGCSVTFTDLAQKVLPFPLFPDRARALESAWEDSWNRVFPRSKTNGLATPFDDFINAIDGWRSPALILNGTRVDQGARIQTSNLVLKETSMVNVAESVRFKLSVAVDNSARFPFISPVGLLENVRTEHSPEH